MINYCKSILIIFLFSSACACQFVETPVEKIKGISFEGPSESVDAKCYDPMIDLNANWVSLMPYAYARSGSSELVFKNLEWQWWGEGYDGTKTCIRNAHSKNLKVMLKPHLWIGHGQFTGSVSFDNETEWQRWENNYRDYLLMYAQLAAEEDVALFCIGTELNAFVTARPMFWNSLIKDVKEVYAGKLTYAGNWDSFQKFPNWTDLDYIGVDAYFPLVKSETPSLAALNEAWIPYVTSLEAFSDSLGKQILFTEYGYRSIDFAASKPWETGRSNGVNLVAQQNAYESLYSSVWNQPWLAGGFLWKWHFYHEKAGGSDDDRFTPQNKPVEILIKNQYSRW